MSLVQRQLSNVQRHFPEIADCLVKVKKKHANTPEQNIKGFQSCAIEAQESAGFRARQHQLISLITVSNRGTENVGFQHVHFVAL